MGFYSKRVGPTLKERLDELAAEPPSKRKSLLEELDIAKAMLVDALAMYERVHTGDLSEKSNVSHKMAVQKHVADAMDLTSRLVGQIAKCDALSPDTFNLQQLHYIEIQMSRILDKAFGDDPRIVGVMLEFKNLQLPVEPERPKFNLVID